MRREDWPQRLLDAIAEAEEKPFVWGEHDCLRFALGCVEAMTGEVWLAGLPKYADEKSALRELKRLGFASLGEALAARFPETPVSLAQRGDLGLTSAPGWDACAVCEGGTWAAVAMDGMLHVPRSAITRAFAVR